MTSSTTLPVDDIRNGPGNIDFQDVTVAGRSAFTFREERDEPGRSARWWSPSRVRAGADTSRPVAVHQGHHTDV